MKTILILLYILGFISIMFVHYNKPYRKYYLYAKTYTSFLFVLIALINMLNHFDLFWFLGFLLLLMGDFFLGINEGDEKQTRNFILGVTSFAIAHLIFIPVMWKVAPFYWINIMIPLIMAAITYLFTQTKFIDTRGNNIACIIYGFIVTSLMIKGIQVYYINTIYLTLMIGTILFFISDFILFFQYFYIKRIPILKFFNLFTYYLAVFLLATTII